MTIAQGSYAAALAAAAAKLAEVSSTPSLDARLLLACAAARDRAWLVAHEREPVDAAAQARFTEFVDRRAAGEPVAYIIGSVGFFGREFCVSSDVLVPRPETEHIVEAALDDVRTRPAGLRRVADIGTGSGAIAITLACEMPELALWATDVSPEALTLARANAQALGAAAQITFLEGDLAAPLTAFAPFACVVANLPYIKTAQVPLRPHPVGYEPPLALDGGVDGLLLYRRLVEQLPPLLMPGASLFFEAAPDTIEALAALVERGFSRAHIEIGEDYSGFERYVAVTLP